MVGEAGETERQEDPQPCGDRSVGGQQSRRALSRHSGEVLFPGRQRREQSFPAGAAGADGVQVENAAPRLLVERRREVVVEGLERPTRVLNRKPHRRERFDRLRLFRIERGAREEREEVVSRPRLDPDVDRMASGGGRFVRSPVFRGGGSGRRRRRRTALERGRRGEEDECGPSSHRRIASIALSTSEKSEKIALGLSAASFSNEVGPVATAIARAPSERPQRTSWTESPTITTPPGENS